MSPDLPRLGSLQEEGTGTQTHTQRDAHMRTWGERGVYPPSRNTSGGTRLSPTWISDSQLPGLGGKKYILFKASYLWDLLRQP